jgi:hypothetical protein
MAQSEQAGLPGLLPAGWTVWYPENHPAEARELSNLRVWRGNAWEGSVYCAGEVRLYNQGINAQKTKQMS